MILADSSIWIEFFRKRDPYFSDLYELIDGSRVVATDFIFAELLQGAKNEREYRFIHSFWQAVPKISIFDVWIRAGSMAFAEGLSRRGVGLVDAAIIVAAKETKSKIWTLDQKLLSYVKAHVGELFFADR